MRGVFLTHPHETRLTGRSNEGDGFDAGTQTGHRCRRKFKTANVAAIEAVQLRAVAIVTDLRFARGTLPRHTTRALCSKELSQELERWCMSRNHAHPSRLRSGAIAG